MNEFNAFIKGGAHRDIDKREYTAWEAVAHAKAQNGRGVTPRKLFNAKAMRNRIEGGFTHKEDEIKRTLALNKQIQGFNPAAHFKPKGGSA